MKNASRKYRAIVPFIPDMGSVSPTICRDTFHESRKESLLWELNKMREHDGLRPLKRIPAGVKWELVSE